MFTLTITGQTAGEIAHDALEFANLLSGASKFAVTGPATLETTVGAELAKVTADKPKAEKPKAEKPVDHSKSDETTQTVDKDKIAEANAEATAKATAKAEAEDEAKAKAKAADTPTVAYAEVQTAIFDAQKRAGRDAVVAVLTKHGLETAKGSDPALWPSLLAAFKAL